MAGVEPTERRSTEGDPKSVPGRNDGKASTESLNPPVGTQVKIDPYASVYSKREKWFIVVLIAFAGMFSPLTANIYLPALPSLATAFHKPVELINLTVTVYMVFQGVSPMFWGTLSDSKGRRPMFILCLLLLSVSCVGLALVPDTAYWLLLLLRCFQAAGSASTIALGAGVIGDIARPEERGGMFGVYGAGPVIGPAIGPVIGGAIDGKLGWRAIFWFMCGTSAACMVFLILFLPETLRALVGDGSYRPSKIYRALIPIVGRNPSHSAQTERPKPKPWINPLPLLKQPDVLLLLMFNGISMGIFYSVATTTSTLFTKYYTFLTVPQIGYCYLALGGSMAIGTLVSGKIMDMDYRRVQQKLLRSKTSAGDPEKGVKSSDDDDFPIEYARLRIAPVLCLIMVATTAAYGWSIQKRASLAVPLILQALLGFVVVWVMNTVQTLLLDLMPTRGSSIIACNNLIRCSTGAVIISVIQPIIDGIGVGWTWVLLAALSVVGSLMIFVAAKIGPRCRKKRRMQASLSR